PGRGAGARRRAGPRGGAQPVRRGRRRRAASRPRPLRPAAAPGGRRPRAPLRRPGDDEHRRGVRRGRHGQARAGSRPARRAAGRRMIPGLLAATFAGSAAALLVRPTPRLPVGGGRHRAGRSLLLAGGSVGFLGTLLGAPRPTVLVLVLGAAAW